MLALIASVVCTALPVDARQHPRLVVGVMIDGLDPQYVDMLREHFGDKGFNRLLRDGVVIANADYGTNLDATAAAAMLMTGASPSTTKITGSTLYNPSTMREVPAMNDPEAMGNFTPQTFSPRALSVSTLADEVKIAGDGVASVYSVAPDPGQAVILAGHAANSALWLNERTGNWATSTFYRDLPASVATRNRTMPLSARLDTMQWTPLKGATSYPGLPDHLTRYPFRHTFSHSAADRMAMFAASPKINTEVTNLAGQLIRDMRPGENGVLDMVNVVYTVKPYGYTRLSDSRYELIDSYLRLDAELERLFATAENAAGPGNTVFFVAATPPSGRSRRDDERWNIPYGEFSTKKARSLLNMYLMAKFGNGDWVTAFFNDQFFLNRNLADERGLDLRTVRLEAAQFLERMSGVDRVYTLDEILEGRGDSRLEALQRNASPATGGDLFVEVAPGWETVDDIAAPAADNRIHYVNRVAPATAPVYILAPGVEPKLIGTPVDARAVAPTVARLLRIRSPNAAALAPLVLD